MFFLKGGHPVTKKTPYFMKLHKIFANSQFALVGTAVVGVLTAHAQPLVRLGDDTFSVTGISGNGQVAIGFTDQLTGTTGYRWNFLSGLQALGDSADPVSSFIPQDLSFDGLALAGTLHSNSYREAFHWQEASGITRLGTLSAGPRNETTGVGISENGQWVVGSAWTGAGIEAYRWSLATGFEVIGDFSGGVTSSVALAVSADGSVVVGRGWNESGNRAFRWTAQTSLQELTGGPGSNIAVIARAITPDGTIVIGETRTATFDENLFRYTDQAGMSLLLPTNIPSDLTVRGITADGLRVVGDVTKGTNSIGFILDSSLGFMQFDQFLTQQGIDATGWTFSSIVDVSADGMRFVGNGTYEGEHAAFLVVIPEPSVAAFAAVGFSTIFLLHLRKKPRISSSVI